MNPETPSKSSDPLGLRADLREALTRAERNQFDDESGRRAAYQLAAALGRCRLFDVDAGEDDETLVVQVALAAVQQWQFYAAQWRQQAADLPAHWDAASSEIEADSLCLDQLEARMETWAIFIAIDEAFEDCLQTGDPRYAVFVKQLDLMMEEMDKLDAALEKQKGFLCVAAGTCLLENWRRLLAPMYCEVLPWWLDGTLEDAWESLLRTAAPARRDLTPLLLLILACLQASRVRKLAPALRATAVAAPDLPSEALQLNAAVFRAEGDDQLRIGFDLAADPDSEELRVYLSPPEAARGYSAVRVVIGQGEPRIGNLFADFASVPVDPAALSLLAVDARGTVQIELLTVGGLARPILIQEAAV